MDSAGDRRDSPPEKKNSPGCMCGVHPPVDLVDLDDPTPLVRYLLDSLELVRVE